MLLGLGLLVLATAAVAGPASALLMLATVLGGVVLVAAVLQPAVALVLIVIVEFSNAGEVTKINGIFAGMLVLGTVSVLVALRHPDARARLRRPPWVLPGLVLCYLVTILPSIRYTLAPTSTAEWQDFLFKDLLLMLLVLALALIVDRPWWIAATIVMTLGTLAALTIVNQLFLGAQPSTFGGFATVTESLGELITTPRHAGPVTDSNFWGRLLVLGLPLSYALIHRSAMAGRVLPQLGWATATAALLGGIYITQSRGTFLAALVATFIWVVASGRRVRQRALLVSPVIAILLLLPGVGNRLINLSEIFEDVPSYAIDPSLVQRSAAQEIAAIIFRDNLLFGTGPGSFRSIIYEYAAQSGDLLIGPTRAQHNTYLEVASESGIVGLIGFLVLLGGIAVIACRSVLRLAGTPQDGRLGAPTRGLAAGSLAAVLGWATASLFLHIEYFRPVLITFVLVSILAKRTHPSNAVRPPAQVAATATATRSLLIGTAAVLVAAAMAGITAPPILGAMSTPRYQVRAVFTLLPAPNIYTAYAIDVRNRVPILPAYAAMIQSSVPITSVRVDAEPEKGIITMTAEGTTLAAAEAELAPAVAGAPAALARFRGDLQYRIVALSQQVTLSADYTVSGAATATAAALVEFTLVGMVVHRMRRRPVTLRPDQPIYRKLR
jgi:O-antigen ligase